MFNKEFHTHDNRTIFPNTIEINEHRAPTDESIKILREMEQKARENVFAQIVDDLPNAFHFDIIVSKLANFDCVSQKIMLYFRINVNGKRYKRKMVVKGDSAIMHDIMLKGGGRHKTIDYSCAVQRYFLLQFSILISSILLDVNCEAVCSLMQTIERTGVYRLNIDDLNLQLEDYEKYALDEVENCYTKK